LMGLDVVVGLALCARLFVQRGRMLLMGLDVALWL
ncbi:MAG: hypothetical protein QOI67_2063, partial [Gaiellaceae bacterium]|nr:hypothetical protein [Gaiellaceae bacterium]